MQMNGRPLMRSAAHAACQHAPARRHARCGIVRLGAADSVRIGLLALLASVPVGPVFLSTLHRHPPHHRACVLSRCCCTGPTRLQVCLLAPPPAAAQGGCALSTRRGAHLRAPTISRACGAKRRSSTWPTRPLASSVRVPNSRQVLTSKPETITPNPKP